MIGKFVALSVQKVADKVVDGVCSLVQSTSTQYCNVEDDIECLKRLVLRIKAILADAVERRYINDEAVNLFLRELKGVKLSADILLDEYETVFRVSEHDSSSVEPSHKRKWYQVKLPSVTADGVLAQRRRFALEIANINKRFEEIIEQRKKLRLRGEDGLRLITLQTVGPECPSEMDTINKRLQALEDLARGQQTMMTLENPTSRESPYSTPRLLCSNSRSSDFASCPHSTSRLLYSSSWSSDQIVIVGRQNEINDIVEQLVSDFRMAGSFKLTVPVVPIHGPPGIGKTVLAKMVFNDKRISVYFDFKAWVSLTDPSDMRAAMEEIYQKMTGQRCNFTGNNMLQKLGEYLMTHQDKKFLLVIDNFCADFFHQWETLQVPLLAGGEGSKVLITTRDEKICTAISSISRPSLSGLDEDECWQLIQSTALPQGVVGSRDERLVPIGKEIAKTCNGLPMVAANLGSILTEKGEGVWSDVLSEMQDLKHEPNVVLACLRVKYHHLPYHLKQCFDSCSIFPKSYPFEKNQVIEHWKAFGLIPAGNGHQPEAISMGYLDDLVLRSFIQKIPTCDKGRSESYILPSLMYDLVRLNAEQEPMGFNRGLVLQEPQADPERHVQNECISPVPRFPSYLRSLDLSRCSSLKFLPASIGYLKHLRYLNLSHTKIKYIPTSVSSLYNLQTLSIEGCPPPIVLPKEICSLTKLQHINLCQKWENITDTTEVIIPPGISKLSKLQTLSWFNVNPVNSRDSNLTVLRDLNLRGNLCLLNLEKVTTSDDAMNANLQAKYLEHLMLRWDSSAQTNHLQLLLSEQVITSLQPNNSLRCLWITNYPGSKYPDWLGYASYSSLETIRISNCKNLSFLSLVGQLPGLKNLEINGVHAKTMRNLVGFPSLEHLSLLNMPFLERIFLENDFPKLKRFYVSDCLYLKEITLHQSVHNKFEKGNCPSLSTIIYVPHMEEVPNSPASEWQGVNQNSMCGMFDGNSVTERRNVCPNDEMTEEEIEEAGESFKKFLRKGKWRLTETDNGEGERPAKRRKIEEFLQMIAEGSLHLENEDTASSGREVLGEERHDG